MGVLALLIVDILGYVSDITGIDPYCASRLLPGFGATLFAALRIRLPARRK